MATLLVRIHGQRGHYGNPPFPHSRQPVVRPRVEAHELQFALQARAGARAERIKVLNSLLVL